MEQGLNTRKEDQKSMDQSPSMGIDDLERLLVGRTSDKLLIIRFGAEWCAPCRHTEPVALAEMERLSDKHKNKIVCMAIDIDESLELYAELKRRRALTGVPSILAYRGTDMQDPWFYPLDSVSGGDLAKVREFFARCDGYVE